MSSHPSRCQCDIGSAPYLSEATVLQGGGTPEGDAWAQTRGHQVWIRTRLSGWLRTVSNIDGCFLAQGAGSHGHEEVGTVLGQHPVLLV